MRRARRMLAGAALGVAVAAGLGFALFKDEILPEDSPASRGFQVAVRAGCFSCHGLDAEAAAPGAKPGLRVPPMLGVRRSIAGLRRIIEDGSHKDSPWRQGDGHLAMPPYRERLAPEDIDDLVAWLALEHHRRSTPSAMSDGERLARQHGCFACHGHLGQGGVENPRSLKGYIPGFFGHDFDALTEGGDRDLVAAWIREGAPRAFLERGVLGIRPAQWFTERQAISMPAYDELLSDAEVDALVEYTLALRRLGPLDADGFERYRRAAEQAAVAADAAVTAAPAEADADHTPEQGAR